jgi:hypothetical protein
LYESGKTKLVDPRFIKFLDEKVKWANYLMKQKILLD